MPSFVVDELRDYLECRVLAHRAVRFACSKGRGVCPRSLDRRMGPVSRRSPRTATTARIVIERAARARGIGVVASSTDNVPAGWEEAIRRR